MGRSQVLKKRVHILLVIIGKSNKLQPNTLLIRVRISFESFGNRSVLSLLLSILLDSY